MFITELNFPLPKDVRLKATHLFIMRIPNTGELQKISHNHLSDMISMNLRDFT